MVTAPPQELHKWDNIVQAIAGQFNLDPIIILSQIWRECEEDVGNPCLTRFEPRYQYFWHPTKHALWESNLSWKKNREIAVNLLGHDEFLFQSTSWSLLQTMGAVARELGFLGTPEELCIPETNIYYGCLHLSNLLRRAHGDYKMALLRYNNSVEYTIEVLRRAAILEQI